MLTMLVAVIYFHLLVLVRKPAEQLDCAQVRRCAILVAVHDADSCLSVGPQLVSVRDP